jgi:hypothetical protein
MKLANTPKNFLANSRLVSDLSIWVLCLLMLCSMGAWFAWNYKGIIIACLSAFFVLLRICIVVPQRVKIEPSIIFLSILVYFVVNLRAASISNIVWFFCHIVVFFFVLSLQKTEKEKIIHLTTLIYAWIVGISIIFYVSIVLCKISFPYWIITNSNEGYNGGDPRFKNYIFLITPFKYQLFDRFRSIFTESGHIGMIASFILYANKYNFKKLSVFIIFIGLLFSLSLAAYVLLILGYVIYQFAIGKKIVTKIIVVVSILVALASIGFYMYVQYPDSIVTTLIVNRLQYDEDQGLAGNNRTTSSFDYYYENNFMGTSYMIWGTGSDITSEKFSWGNNSYKVFIFQYGFIGIISLFMFYFCMAYSGKSWLSLGLFMLYSASFLQRTYALWEMELFLFVGAIESFYINNRFHLTKAYLK